jgi:tetratricopeptide (TPR) repeat protein
VCDLFDAKESTEKIRAHAVAAFYLESYFDARKHYEILVKRHKATAMDYVRLAYIYARHNQKENAIISWCKALEINKRQKIAKNILAHIKEKGREIGMFEDDYIRKVSTKRPIFIPFKSIFQGTVAGSVLAVF